MKKITTISLIILLLSLAITVFAAEIILNSNPTPTTTVSSGPVFLRSLTVGSSGQDVMALKKILSLELGITQDKTATYTSGTANDVKSFQEKYPVEILIPAGLTEGNGTVGATTITQLNKLAAKYNINLSDFVVPVAVPVVSTAPFNRNLTLGDSGSDVILLKFVLNSDPATALSYLQNKVPAGTENLFDSATQLAVKKFQEKYASEILTPSGLTSGTGGVGLATRKKLVQILNNLTNASTGTNTTIATGSNSTIKIPPVQNYSINFIPSLPAPSQPTVTARYPEYNWTVGPWSACSSQNIQTRTVKKVLQGYYSFEIPLGPQPASTQSCIKAPAPTGLAVKCLGTSAAILSWTPVSAKNADGSPILYPLRIDNLSNDWDTGCKPLDGDICMNYPLNSFPFPTRAGATYHWWVHSIVDGTWSSTADGGNFTCGGVAEGPKEPPLVSDCKIVEICAGFNLFGSCVGIKTPSIDCKINPGSL